MSLSFQEYFQKLREAVNEREAQALAQLEQLNAHRSKSIRNLMYCMIAEQITQVNDDVAKLEDLFLLGNSFQIHAQNMDISTQSLLADKIAVSY